MSTIAIPILATPTTERSGSAPPNLPSAPLHAPSPVHFGETETDAARWRASVASCYDRLGNAAFRPARHYYYRRIIHRLRQMVEPGARVLDIGCGDGELLAAMRPSVGVGIDLSDSLIGEARRRFPDLRFVHGCGEDVYDLSDTFDYVIISQTLGEVYDVQTLLHAVQRVCHARTRLLIVHESRVWQPALRLMEWLRIKNSSPEKNWLPSDEVTHLLSLADFETIRMLGLTIAPVRIPLLSDFLNRVVGNLPVIHEFALNYVIVARTVRPDLIQATKPRSVSIVVPARNEAGHIAQILPRIPQLAPRQEVIFVEGNSHDDTWETVEREAAAYSGPYTVQCLRQEGRGKGDAVRKGFDAATGEVLMILDADLSVPPEELRAFYDVLASGRGEFINGSRMVYLMDRRAMRFLNLLGNKAFGWMFTYLLSQGFRDTLCGTKVLLRSDYQRIARNRSFFGDFDPFGDFDLLFGAAKLNLRIVDVPVHYKARTYGETNISRFQHGWMLLKMCFLAARKLKFV